MPAKIRALMQPAHVGAVRLGGLGIGVQQGVGAKSGAAQGAAEGASFGPWGAVIGAVVGAVAGSMNKKDPEDANFQQAQAMGQANPQSVLNIANKYLVLAGLFDLQPGQIKGNIPMYRKYGRMGEQRFVTDLMNVVYQAAKAGQISTNDTPQSIYQRIVQPWMDSWGLGPLSDSNAQMLMYLMMGMVAEYIIGQQGYWLDVNGGTPFTGLPGFPMASVIGNQLPAATNSPVPAQTALTFSSTSFGPPPPGYVLQQGHPSANDPYAGFYTDASGTLYSWARGNLSPTGSSLVVSTAPAASPVRVPDGFVNLGSTPINGVLTALYKGPDGTVYALTSGQLVPYSSPSSTTVAMPAPANAVQPSTMPSPGAVQSAVSPTYSAPVMTSGSSIISEPSPIPTTSAAGMAVTAFQSIPSWAWAAGVGLLALLLFKRKLT